jgi:hypothetical protein
MAKPGRIGGQGEKGGQEEEGGPPTAITLNFVLSHVRFSLLV